MVRGLNLTLINLVSVLTIPVLALLGELVKALMLSTIKVQRLVPALLKTILA